MTPTVRTHREVPGPGSQDKHAPLPRKAGEDSPGHLHIHCRCVSTGEPEHHPVHADGTIYTCVCVYTVCLIRTLYNVRVHVHECRMYVHVGSTVLMITACHRLKNCLMSQQ